MSPLGRFAGLAPIERNVIKLAAFCAICLVVIIALVIAVVALSTANGADDSATTANHGVDQANRSIAAQCQFYHGAALASGPTIPPQTSVIGLTILAGARVAYEGLGCKPDDLPKPDPRVGKLIPRGFH